MLKAYIMLAFFNLKVIVLVMSSFAILERLARAQQPQFLREPPFILYCVNQKDIKVINLDGTNPTTLISEHSGHCPTRLDYDIRRGFVYWTDNWCRPSTIWCLDVQTEGAEPVVIRVARNQTDDTSPIYLEHFYAVALDWVNNILYISDTTEREVEAHDLNDNTYRTVVSGDGLVSVRMIALDPINNWMYLLDHGAGRIERAHLDGTGREIIINTGLNDAYTITIDIPNQNLYWTNHGGSNIETARVDGSGRTTVRGVTEKPYGVSYFGGSVYYTDWKSQRVNCVSNDGTLTTLITEDEVSQQSRRTTGIAVVHPARQPLPGVIDECQTSLHNCDGNAVCTDLENGFTCTCKLGYTGDGTACLKATVGVPNKPDITEFKPTATRNEIVIVWTTVIEGLRPVENYTIQFRVYEGDPSKEDEIRVVNVTVKGDVTQHTFVITDVEKVYDVKICAVNEFGETCSDVYLVQVTAAPPVPDEPGLSKVALIGIIIGGIILAVCCCLFVILLLICLYWCGTREKNYSPQERERKYAQQYEKYTSKRETSTLSGGESLSNENIST